MGWQHIGIAWSADSNVYADRCNTTQQMPAMQVCIAKQQELNAQYSDGQEGRNAISLPQPVLAHELTELSASTRKPILISLLYVSCCKADNDALHDHNGSCLE